MEGSRRTKLRPEVARAFVYYSWSQGSQESLPGVKVYLESRFAIRSHLGIGIPKWSQGLPGVKVYLESRFAWSQGLPGVKVLVLLLESRFLYYSWSQGLPGVKVLVLLLESRFLYYYLESKFTWSWNGATSA